MAAQGLVAAQQAELTQRLLTQAHRPPPVVGISPATRNHTYYVDPTIALQQAITDAKGNLLFPVGSRLNPLRYVTWSSVLLFIDGDDAKQVAWAQKQDTQFAGNDKLILVKGDIAANGHSWPRSLYFDQAGRLAQRFGIHHTPACVQQHGLYLRIQEKAI